MAGNPLGQACRRGREVSQLLDIRAPAGRVGDWGLESPGGDSLTVARARMTQKLGSAKTVCPSACPWPLRVAWTSSQRGSLWAPELLRRSPAAGGGSYTPFCEPDSKITVSLPAILQAMTSLPNSREVAQTLPFMGRMSKDLQVFLKLTEGTKCSRKDKENVLEEVLLSGGEEER